MAFNEFNKYEGAVCDLAIADYAICDVGVIDIEGDTVTNWVDIEPTPDPL